MNANKPSIGGRLGSKRKQGPKKGKSLQSLRNKLDKIFSLWIRKRDANDQGIGSCYTCNQVTKLEAGHFIPRQHAGSRWDDRNVHGQCNYCNRWQHSNPYAYGKRLALDYGQAVVDELWASKRQAVKWSRTDLEVMIDKYSANS